MMEPNLDGIVTVKKIHSNNTFSADIYVPTCKKLYKQVQKGKVQRFRPVLVNAPLKADTIFVKAKKVQPVRKCGVEKLIAKLKGMEKKTGKSTIMQEIDIASQQLEEIKKLLMMKASQDYCHPKKSKVSYDWDVTKPKRTGGTREFESNRRKIDKLQKHYSTIPHVRYKSVNEFVSMYTRDDMAFVKWEEENENEMDTNKSLKLEDEFKIEQEFRNNRPPSSQLEVEVTDEKRALNVTKDEKSEDVGNLNPVKPLNETEFGKRTLEKSLLKSDYLLKEFGIDLRGNFFEADKERVAEKISVELFGTGVHKFRERGASQLTNSKGRDRKLYSQLNLALKNSLYNEIHE